MSFGIPVRNGLMLGLGASTALSTRAGAKPAMALNFLQPFLDSRITFSRGTGATRVNASGFIETVGNTTPRFDYDPVTLAPRGLLIEEARTNLLTYSEQFDNAAWTKTRSSVVANTTTSPDGTANADTLVEDTTAAATHPISAAVTLTAAAHAYSVYLKANGRSWAQLNLLSTANAFANFNLSTGAIGVVGAAATASIQNAGNGWYRCTIVATTAAGANTAAVYPASADNVISFTGSGAAALFLYGAQLEAGSFATSYIPTVASTVTRNADVATMTGTNFSSWYNQSEGTFVGEASFFGLGKSTSDGLLDASNGTANETIAMFRTGSANNIASAIRDGGVDQATYVVALGSQPVKVATAYATNNTNFAQNGLAQTTDTACTMPTPDRLLIGSIYSAGNLPTNGHIRTIAYFNTRLPNAQLQTLTAPSLATTLSLDFTSGSYNVGF